jgi:hypothetical protein
MNVVLRKSRKLIGTLTGTTSTGDGIPLPIALKTKAYRCGRGIAWEPDPPPNPKRPVEIPYLLDRNSDGEFEMVIDEVYEGLFRSHPEFRNVP